jgi:hypothetical protein
MSFDNSEWRGRRVDLLRYVRRRVDDAALREDIVQEAIIRLLVYQATPGISIANITALLRRICLDLTRTRGKPRGVDALFTNDPAALIAYLRSSHHSLSPRVSIHSPAQNFCGQEHFGNERSQGGHGQNNSAAE